jgi:anti-sigma factor RsiW
MIVAGPNNSVCRSEAIVAYLDGELDASSLAELERHLKDCAQCAAALEAERRLLRELDLALGDETGPSMPENFAEVVAARAQSDMRGLRARRERRRALVLCSALAGLSFALLGGGALAEAVLAPLRVIWKCAVAVFGFLGHALYDAGAGVAVISRRLGGHLLWQSPRGLSLLLLLLLALALFMLPRLIIRYHRTKVIE